MALPLPSNHYSTDPFYGTGPSAQDNKEQFIAYFRVLPKAELNSGKRREYEVALIKLSARLESAMVDLGYTITESRPFEKPQFGQKTAMVSMIGFMTVVPGATGYDYRPNAQTLSSRKVDHSGSMKTGVGGNVQHGQVPTTALLTAVSEFKATVDAMLATDFIAEGFPVTLAKLDYQGVTFGVGGIHFPQ